MELGIIKNGVFQYSNGAIVFENGGWISNPTEQQYIENGYKEVIRENEPILNENESSTFKIIETDTQILLTYEIIRYGEVL